MEENTLTTIIDRLRLLKEYGQMVNMPTYTIAYNRFRDTFSLEVPDDKKDLELNLTDGRQYLWSASGMFPVEVQQGAKSYEEVWQEMEPYSHGATVDLIPVAYEENGLEYVWVDDADNGIIPVCKLEIFPF